MSVHLRIRKPVPGVLKKGSKRRYGRPYDAEKHYRRRTFTLGRVLIHLSHVSDPERITRLKNEKRILSELIESDRKILRTRGLKVLAEETVLG